MLWGNPMSDHWLLQDEHFNTFSTAKLVQLLDHESPFYRAQAISVLTLRSIEDEALIPRIVDAIRAPSNMEQKTIGILTVSYHGIACLLATGTKRAYQAAQHVLETWPQLDKDT